MEFFLLLIVAGVIWWWTKVGKSVGRSPTKTTHREVQSAASLAPISNAAPEVKIMVTTTFVSRDSADDDETGPNRRAQGALQAVGSGCWLLNPESPFPLTLLGADESVAGKVKELLDSPKFWSRNVPQLSFLISQHDLRFRELDQWIGQLKPLLEADIAKRIKDSAEWNTASERDKLDLHAEYKQSAIRSLGMYIGSGDLATLLLEEPKDFGCDDEIMRYFAEDPELYSFYLSQLDRKNPVATAKADDWGRKSWERLVDAGLALRGRDIPMQLLLEGQRLKDLNELLVGTIPKPIGKKAKALEAVLALPDLEIRLSKLVSFREQFQAIPPADTNIESLSASFGYATQVAQVIFQTYDTASQTVEWLHRQKETPQHYKGWEIKNWTDPSPACSKVHCRTYKGDAPRLPPFHIGCNCQMIGLYS